MEDRQRRIQEVKDNITWLHRNVAPDDIYEFAEQALLSLDYFSLVLYQKTDFIELISKDILFAKLFNNHYEIRKLRDQKSEAGLNLYSIYDLE